MRRANAGAEPSAAAARMISPSRASFVSFREGANVIVLVAIMWLLGSTLGIEWQSAGTIAGILAIAVAGLELLWGLGGQGLLGQNGFVAVGAYSVALIATKTGIPTVVALLLSGPIAAVAGMLLWPIIRRLGEMYFAIATLGFGLLVPSLAVALIDITGGASGIAGIAPLNLGFGPILNPDTLYNIAWVLAGVFILLVLRIKRSPMGLALETMRSDPLVASACGVDTVRLRRTAFLYSIVVAGWAGGLYSFAFLAITPGDFGFTLALELFAMQVLGGLGSGYGAIVGAATIGLLTMGTNQGGSYSGVLYGGLFVAALLVAPGGLVGLWNGLLKRLAELVHWKSPSVDLAAFAKQPGDGVSAPTDRAVVALEAKGIWKVFGGVVANKAVDIGAPRHAVTGLIGANGAGKSTLLNVLSGQAPADVGSVYVEEKVASTETMSEIARSGVARTFQIPRWIGRLSVRENVASGSYRFYRRSGLFSGMSPAGKRQYYEMLAGAGDALARVGVGELAARPADTLSFGQIRLLELARGLASDPMVMLLDEPLSGLDDDEKARICDLFRSLASDGMAIVLVEHDTEAVKRSCDTVFVMDFGEIIAVAPAASVFELDVVRKSYMGDETGEKTVSAANDPRAADASVAERP